MSARKRKKNHRTLLWGLRKIVFGNQAEKRMVRYRLAEIAAGLFCDVWMGEDNKAWWLEQEFLNAYQTFEPKNRRSAERKWAVRELVRSIADVPGDTAECGVYWGASSYFICEARGRGTHHVFDSFEGLSEPDAADRPDDADAVPWSAGELSVTEEDVRQRLARFPFVEFYRGWIPDQFHRVEDREFCFVHVDVDLYQPTLDSIEFFYPRLTSGGMIVCDDYGFTKCPGSRKACDEFGERIGRSWIFLPTGQGLLLKR